jgi:hypothetical protein
MEDTFDIPVTYKGKELLFKSQLLIWYNYNLIKRGCYSLKPNFNSFMVQLQVSFIPIIKWV